MSARSGIPAFEVMRVIDAVVARRATGLPVFDLSAGQPSTPAPTTVRAAAARAIGADRLGYTNALGIPALRAAIARHYLRTDDLDVPAGSVAVTTGSSGGFLLAFLAAFDPGDTVVMARPGYPAYRNMLAALGCTVLELACGPETRFQPTAAQLDALPVAPQGIVLASPANPTGTMVAPAELAAITAWCDLHGVRLVSDEIYHGISYTEPAISAWRFSRSSIVVNSFSKYFSMTGWRAGWLLVPDELLDAVDRLAGNFTICPPAMSQVAAPPPSTPTTSWTRMSCATRAIVICCCTGYRRSASIGSRLPTARSTSTPTSRAGPITRSGSRRVCSPKPASPWRPASTSIHSTAAASSGCVLPATPPRSTAPSTCSATGCRTSSGQVTQARITLDVSNASRYASQVLRSFRDKDTERIWRRERSRRLDQNTQRAALRKLLILDAAEVLDDVRVPPGNRLEKLRGDRAGQYSVRVNQQWRICFRWSPAGPEDVEIVDYH